MVPQESGCFLLLLDACDKSMQPRRRLSQLLNRKFIETVVVLSPGVAKSFLMKYWTWG